MPATARPYPWYKSILDEFSTGLNEHTPKGRATARIKSKIDGKEASHTKQGWRYGNTTRKGNAAKRQKVKLPNGTFGYIYDNDSYDDTIGFAAHHFMEGDGLEEFQEIIEQAFPADNNNNYWEVNGVGHIVSLKFNSERNLLWVSFAKGADVIYSKVPSAVVGQLIAYAENDSFTVSPVTGERVHLLGVEFWNLIRIRGQLHGSRYPFEYYRYNENVLGVDLSQRYVISDGRLKNYTIVPDESEYAKVRDVRELAAKELGLGRYFEDVERDVTGERIRGANDADSSRVGMLDSDRMALEALTTKQLKLYEKYKGRRYPMLTEKEEARLVELQYKLREVNDAAQMALQSTVSMSNTSDLAMYYAKQLRDLPEYQLGETKYKFNKKKNQVELVRMRSPKEDLVANMTAYMNTPLGDIYQNYKYDETKNKTVLTKGDKRYDPRYKDYVERQRTRTLYNIVKEEINPETGEITKIPVTAAMASKTPDMRKVMQDAQIMALRDIGLEGNQRRLGDIGHRYEFQYDATKPFSGVNVQPTIRSAKLFVKNPETGLGIDTAIPSILKGADYNDYIRLTRKVRQYSINKYDKEGGAYNLIKYRGKPWTIQQLIDFGKSAGSPGHISTTDAPTYNKLIKNGQYQFALDYLKSTIPSYRKKKNKSNGHMNPVYGDEPLYYAGYFDIINYEDF